MLGLLGLLGSFIPVLNIGGIVLGVVGAVLAAVGLAKAKKSGVGKGLAVSGLILGVLALIIGIVVNVAFANVVSTAAKDVTGTSVKAPTNSASAAAAIDDAIGKSRAKPAPLGSAITGGDWSVTINSVTTAAADSLGQAPKAGSALLVVNLTATYNGKDSKGAAAWASVDFVTAEGTTIDGLQGSKFFMPTDAFKTLTNLYEGASVTGAKMIEVPADSWQQGVLAVSPALLSDHTFVAVT
ncbi:MAG: hypothetical protein HHJ10_13350 [Cellulomonas sp.]|uniref:DUF4190 domain-containing protein n=1 Tax=Cellulomonas sp. TaxID=40001 RepID=UPI0017CB82C3|nr:DUF4190 domain-containing protein [Cellulomonas sp.]NMM31986.1 hypothetical protein [Cellulomonas sp.]